MFCPMSTICMFRLSSGVSLLVSWIIPASAYAQFMLSPVAVTETGLGTFSQDVTPLVAMIDQSGLYTPFQSGTTSFDNYFAPANTNWAHNADKTKWQSDFSFDLPFGGNVDFDLGDMYRVSKAAIWNISVKALAVQVASNTNGPWQEAGQFTFFDQQPSLSLESKVLDFGAEYVARYVRLAVQSEFPATPTSSFGYVTIGEFVVRAAPVGAVQPTLALRLESNGDVTLTFGGTLQSGANANGPFDDVPSNPRGNYTIPKASLAANQFFRARN